MQLFNAGVFTVGYLKGFLRRIKYGDVEIVRMIYMALRDQNWNTYEPIIQHEEIEKHGNGFSVKYDCFYELKGKKIFQWHVTITGTPGGEISFEIQGEALTDVLKNRAGLCILHPVAHTAGETCELHHTDGSRTENTFPTSISAENPFKNLKSFRWKCQGKWYSLEYEGDGFETEDQRNWSDASYKTFCTPLDIPFPVLLKAGEKVYQKVIFRPDEDLPTIPHIKDKPIEIVASDKTSPLPKIGIAASTESDALSQENISALRDLRLHHYRVEVNTAGKNWIDKFTTDCELSASLDLPLEIAILAETPGELKSFHSALTRLKPNICHFILLNPNTAATDQLLINHVPSLKKLYPSVLIGGGTDYNYRELNVNRFDGEPLDFISYSIDPQEHATDDLTIIENIAAQADTVQSARDIYGHTKTIHISSLTLRKRFNPAATVTADKILPNERKADPRQQTEIAALFTLGSIKCLSIANANSVTYYQTVGNQGVVSVKGDKYPVYKVLREILSTQNHRVIHTVSSDPLSGDALLLTDGKSNKLILINYTAAGLLLAFQNKRYTLGPYEIRTVDTG